MTSLFKKSKTIAALVAMLLATAVFSQVTGNVPRAVAVGGITATNPVLVTPTGNIFNLSLQPCALGQALVWQATPLPAGYKCGLPTAQTEWVIATTTTDAGADKTSAISRTGRVNVGTTAQGNGSLFNVIGQTNNQVNIAATNGWGLLMGYGSGATTGTGYHGLNHAAVINVNNAPLHLGSNNASVAKVQNDGIGVGLPWATAPSTQLHINAPAVNDTGLRLEQSKQGVTQATGIDTVAVGVDTTGKVRVTNAVGSADNRAVNSQPQAYQAGSYNEFKQATTLGLNTIAPSVGGYVGLQTFRRYGLNADFSGGQVRQEATTDDGRKYYRISTSATAWGAWENTDPWFKSTAFGASATSPGEGFHYDAIVSYQGNGTFSKQTIQTNIPANTYVMPTIFLKGYAYGTSDTVDLQLGFYTYTVPANSIINTVWQSRGTRSPVSVRAGFTSGLLTLEIDWGPAGDYFLRYEASSYTDGNGTHRAAWFKGWTVTSAGMTAATTNIVTFPRKSNNQFLNVPNYASVAAANADAALLAGSMYTVTAAGGKALYLK